MSDLGNYTQNVTTIEPKATIASAAKLMREHHVGELVVVDVARAEGEVVGVLTDRDITVSVVAEDWDSHVVRVDAIMEHHPVTINENSSPFEAAKIMAKKGIRRLPVLNSQKKLVGILALDDLFDYISQGLTHLSEVSRKQIHHERENKEIKVSESH